MNKKYTWSSDDGPQSALVDRRAKQTLQVLKTVEESDVKDLSDLIRCWAGTLNWVNLNDSQ